jgi:glutathione synthase/RimK-type ligase-like ATP-grasp enzyme
VTYEGAPALHEDDHLLVRAFAVRGVAATPAIWSGPSVDWSTFDAALLRSTWDYFHRLPEFLAWVTRIASLTRLYNPPKAIRWNCDKRYLRDLGERGVPIIATVWREPGERLDLAQVVRATGWSRLVVKPAVSGGAFATLLVEDDGAAREKAETELAAVSRERAFLIQPYLPSVADGEASLFYFGGRFSHAVLKRPVPGEFRVQEMFGGIASLHEPSPAERAVAAHALAASAEATGEGLLYARIDLLAGDDGAPRLIEVEAIEPFLFLAQKAGSEEALVTALLARHDSAANGT